MNKRGIEISTVNIFAKPTTVRIPRTERPILTASIDVKGSMSSTCPSSFENLLSTTPPEDSSKKLTGARMTFWVILL